MQTIIDEDLKIQTPENVKIFGLGWNRVEDSFFVKDFQLDKSASTKREVLSSVQKIFDIFGYKGPQLKS